METARFKNKAKCSSSCGRQQFTLIELLIVIAIIAILASMLLPALRRAKMTSKNIVCRGNLKQVGLIFAQYATDNNGWTLNHNYRSGGWSYRLMMEGYAPIQVGAGFVYSNKPSIFVCPSAYPYVYSSQYYTYGMRRQGGGGYDYFRIGASPIRFANAATNSDAGTVKPTVWRNPSRMFFIADSKWSGITYIPAKQSYYFNLQGAEDSKLIQLRHSNRGNMLYADMHVDGINKSNAKSEYGLNFYDQEGVWY